MKTLTMTTVALLVLGLAVPVFAQQDEPWQGRGPEDRPGFGQHRGPGGGQGRGQGGPWGPGPGGGMRGRPEMSDKETQELVKTLMMVRLSEELELTDEQTVIMMRRIEKFNKENRNLAIERRKLVQALKQSIEEKATDSEILSQLEKLIKHDQGITTQKFKLIKTVGEGLTVEQNAKLYVFMGDFENEMRKLVRRARQQVGPPRGQFGEGGPGQFGEGEWRGGGQGRGQGGPGRGQGGPGRGQGRGGGGQFQPPPPPPPEGSEGDWQEPEY